MTLLRKLYVNANFLAAILVSASCGNHGSSAIKIIGGRPVQKSEPVSKSVVSFIHESNNKTFCSGILIARDIVLTAGHCIQAMNDHDSVGLGVMQSKQRKSQIKLGHMHSEYNESQLFETTPSSPPHDIGLIQLSEPIKGAVPMTNLGDSNHQNRLDQQLVDLYGFGADQVDPFTGSGQLRTVEVSLETTDFLEFKYSQKPGHSACVGDSGGPVIAANTTHPDAKLKDFNIVGIISRGDTNCQESGYITSVSSHLEWIKATVSKLQGPEHQALSAEN
jgi:secreted trypsin-like serine protease